MSATKIDTAKTDLKTATNNRQIIENGVAGGGKVELPSGLTVTDQEVNFGPQHSGGQFTGQGLGRSVLRNLYTAGPSGQYGLQIYGREITSLGLITEGTLLGDVEEGTLGLEALANIPPGTLVYVTQGLSYIDGKFQEAMTGEYRRIAPGNAFDRPISRDYLSANHPEGGPERPCYAVPVQAVEDLVVADLTIAQPVNGQASPLLVKYMTGWFHRVGLGLPGEVNQRSGVNTSAPVAFLGCESNAPLELNTCHGIDIADGFFGGLRGEESCSECLLIRTELRINGNSWNGLDWTNGSDRLTAQDVTVYGGGQWYDSGVRFSIRATGRECVLRNVRDRFPVVVAPGWSAVQIAGDRLLAEGLETQMPVQVLFGQGMVLNRCTAAAWDLRPGTGGVATDCKNMPVDPAQIPGPWIIRG